MGAGQTPNAPFDKWPEQWVIPGYGFAWLTEDPPALITQTTIGVAGPAEANRLQDFFDEVVAIGFVQRHKRVLALHDWRSIVGTRSGVRQAYIARSNRPGKPYKALGPIYLVTNASGILRVLVQTAGATLNLTAGLDLPQLVGNPQEVLLRHAIQGPPPELQRQLLMG